MSEPLFPYYQRELVFFRQFADEFARQYPDAARGLRLEPNRAADPHVERLIEAFALIAGRIHRKLDDEFPELTESLLGVLYPHYLAPIPSLAVVQFEVDPANAQKPGGALIPRHSRLHTAAVAGLPCRFRTCYDVRLWPVAVQEARLQLPPFAGLKPPPRTQAVLRLKLACTGELPFPALFPRPEHRLRFHLCGEAAVVTQLYEYLFNNVTEVHFRPLRGDTAGPHVVRKPEECLFPVGFAPDEGLLDYPPQSFPGYRLLTEFFSFPTKFHFLDLGGFDRLGSDFGRELEVVCFLHRGGDLDQAVNAQTFRTGCTPVVNLFEQTAEPIPLTQRRYEYLVKPDVAHPLGFEVYSVDAVTSVNPQQQTTTEYQPFFSFRHGVTRDDQRAFWYATRRPSLQDREAGTDVYLSLVDLDFEPTLPAAENLVIRTTCSNRDLPVRLQSAGEELYLELEMGAPLLHAPRCLLSPTRPLRPPRRRGTHWRLISHLALNHLSLTGAEGRLALQEILKLYDYADPNEDLQLAAVNQQLIEGITAVSTRRVVARTGAETASGFCRGVEVSVEFDSEHIGGSLFLFASVLERFLGLYVSINSFSQMVARTTPGAVLKTWKPRTGEMVLH